MGERSCARRDAGIPPSGARLPVDPTSPMCAPRDDNHNTPEPPPLGKGGGVTPPANQDPRAPGVQPMGWPRPGRGRTWVVGEGPRPWEARTCRVPRGGESERPRALHPAASGSGCPGPPLPRARPGRTCVPRGRAARAVRAPRAGGTVRNDNNSTRRGRGGRKVSGPHGSTVHRGREDAGQRAGQ